MQAIVTKYVSPTNTRGARVKAVADAGSLTIEWDHRLNIERNHAAACAALVAKLGWQDCEWLQGGMPDVSDYAFCFVCKDND